MVKLGSRDECKHEMSVNTVAILNSTSTEMMHENILSLKRRKLRQNNDTMSTLHAMMLFSVVELDHGIQNEEAWCPELSKF